MNYDEYTFRKHALKTMGFRKYFTSVIAGNTVRFIAIFIGIVFLPFSIVNAIGEWLCENIQKYTRVTNYFKDEWNKSLDSFRELAEHE